MGSQRLAHSWATEHTHTTSFPAMVTFEVLRKWEKPKWYLEEGNRGKVKKKQDWRIKWVLCGLLPLYQSYFFHHPRFPGLYVVQHQPLKHIWLCSRRIVDRSGTKQSADWISSSHVDYKVWNETLGYTCLFPFWFPQCVCPAVGLLDHKAVLFSVF